MLTFETWDIERFIEYARNPRKNDHAVDKIAATIKEFGFRVPVIAKSDGLVVDGHLRLKAAKKLGMKEVPVILADDLTDAQIKAFRLSVNRMAELAEWDDELLRLELSELELLEFDLALIGFDDFDLSIDEDIQHIEISDIDENKDKTIKIIIDCLEIDLTDITNIINEQLKEFKIKISVSNE